MEVSSRCSEQNFMNQHQNYWWNLLTFKIRVIVDTMTMETCLNIHSFYFLSHLLNLPGIKHSYISFIFKTKQNFPHNNVFLPSVAKLISWAIIFIYCIHFSFYSLLIPLKSLEFPEPSHTSYSEKGQEIFFQYYCRCYYYLVSQNFFIIWLLS